MLAVLDFSFAYAFCRVCFSKSRSELRNLHFVFFLKLTILVFKLLNNTMGLLTFLLGD